ncbi:hypothetical protein [Dickeya dadantii]|uniref:hypothetical protein n=1 Tax=Dickeya dadantii TaxID=204038 RepID=UPI001C12F4D7|nr:hypothetical protein [Dickeya dadantii]
MDSNNVVYINRNIGNNETPVEGKKGKKNESQILTTILRFFVLLLITAFEIVWGFARPILSKMSALTFVASIIMAILFYHKYGSGKYFFIMLLVSFTALTIRTLCSKKMSR